MKVAMWYNNRDIRLEDAPMPRPGPGEMVVKIHACGICGSDIVEWYRLPRAPLVQGHEIGAEVVEVGASVTQYSPGDRVFIAPKVPCMACDSCRDGHYPVCTAVDDRLPGGFAQYILVPEALVEEGTSLLPDGVSYDLSTFIEPLACVVRAQNLSGVDKARTLLVLGCGMSGLLHIKLAKARGGISIAATDISPFRMGAARRFGADLVMDAGDNIAERPASETGGKADVVMICTSALSAVDQAWACVNKGGAVVFFAVPEPGKPVFLPANEFWRQEIRILTSYYCGPPDLKEALSLIDRGVVKLEDMITHRLPLKDIGEGFRLVTEGKKSIKVIIHPNAEE
ncbi:MAG: alcohol dehydrogenase catalytic domain-containing protein [Pseudomonadota bacterium]|nr:alcohol dehydrogenase catalytic domain-containing protein [Acidobacteriota bacterium]MBU1339044.1 alcohol dehydrogenase catalytic domain-containing protein [Acidobacteriota bacterium]MBU1475714.1 alcohol dehydrogenase catalytic domain-containing protein [Acidobacteriota bacterium]